MQHNPVLTAVLSEVQIPISCILFFLSSPPPFSFLSESARVENEGFIKSLSFLYCLEYAGFVLIFPICQLCHIILFLWNLLYFFILLFYAAPATVR